MTVEHRQAGKSLDMPGDGHHAHEACVACVAGGVDLATLVPLCARLTPRIERHPGILLLDLAGSERLLLGRADRQDDTTHQAAGHEVARWPRMAERLQHLLADARAEVRADAGAPRVAIAPGRGVAWLAARMPGPSWRAIAPRQIAPFLHPLPVAALLTLPDLAQMPGATQALAGLRQSGIHTIGQLARLAPRTLRARFGTVGMALAQLAGGQDLAPLCVAPPQEWMGARLRLDPPLALDHLTLALDPLAAYLARALHQRRQEASEVLLVVRIEGQQPPWRATHRLGHATASREALRDHACRLIECLGAACPSTHETTRSVASAIHLRVGGLRPARPRQTALWPVHDKQQAQQVARRLAQHHGEAILYQAVLAAPSAVLPEERYTLHARQVS